MASDWRLAVAFRLFGSVSKNRLISFIGFLSISGLVLAVGVLVTVLSVINGFERELKDRVLSVLTHGTVYSHDDFRDWRVEADRLERHPEVSGVAPVVEGNALIVADGRLTGVTFKGIEPERELEVSDIPKFVIEGSLADLQQEKFGAVLGAELAEQIGVVTGDKFTLVLPDIGFSLGGPVMTTKQLKVVGLFRVGADIDKGRMYIHLPVAMQLRRQHSVDGLAIRTKDIFSAPRVLQELVLAANTQDLYGVSWMRRHGNLYEAIRTQKATMFLLLLILVAVAAFNVVSNLVMTVDDNRPQIAVLRTLGASPGDLRVIFILHGFMVGVSGVLLGIVVGLGFTAIIGPAFSLLTRLLDLNLMSEYFIRYLPTEVLFADITAIAVVSMVICVSATIYPASRAATANPAEALKYEV